jgi:hypothetical protein
MKHLILSAAAASVLLLAGCTANLSAEQSQKYEQHEPVEVAKSDGLTAYVWKVPDPSGGSKTIYVVKGANVVASAATSSCGKGCLAQVGASNVQ